MNKILLINPNPSEFIKPSSFNMVQPNALLMLGSALKEAHCDPIILDLRLSSDIKSDIQKVFPRNMLFVGITMMTSQISQALKVLKIIKELDSQIPVIVGGVHPTLFPEQVLREPEIDFCVMYEGEETIIELTQELKNNSADFHKIKGIGYKKNGAVMINPKREFIKMDTLPFINWDLLDMSPYMLTKMSFLGSRHSVNIQSSRGCPYTCTFCINVCLKERWRCKSPERVIEEIRKAKEKLNINFVYFRDENFFVKKDRALEIATGMKELGIEWCANARANYFNDRNLSVETLTQLSNCNLKMLGIGAESGSQRILDKLSKGITVEDVIRTAEYLSTTDIIGNFSFLTGIPTETKEEILATVNVIKKIQKINKKIILAGPQIFRPYPGGTLYEECIRYGLQAPQSLKEWATVDLLETRGSLPLSKLPWIKEKDLTLAVNQYVVMASFPISQFGFSPRGLMVLISKIRYAFGFFKFPVEYKLFYTFKKFMTTIKKKPKTHNYACIIANKLDDRLRLVTRVITEKYRDVSHYYFYYTRSPVNRIKGMQDIEDELHDITTKNNEIIFRTGESLIKKLAVIVKIISMDIRYIFISAEFKSNIFSMMIIYLFCLVKGIHIIFIESNNTFNTKGTVKVKDIFSLFTRREKF